MENDYKILNLLLRLRAQIPSNRKKQLGLLFCLMIFASFSEIFSIGALIPFLGALVSPENIFSHPRAAFFIDFFNFTEPKDIVLPITVLFCVAVLLSGIVRLLLTYFTQRVSHLIGADLGYKMLSKTLHQPYSTHVSTNSSTTISTITTKANQTIQIAVNPVLNMMSATLMLLGITITLLFVDPLLTLISLASFISIYIGVLLTFKRFLGRSSALVAAGLPNILRTLQEGLGGIRNVLIDNKQDIFLDRFRSTDLPVRLSQAKIHFLSSSPRYVVESLGMISIAIVIYFGIFNSQHQDIRVLIPTIGMLAIAAQRILPLLQLVYGSWANLIGGAQFLVDTLDLLEKEIIISSIDTKKRLLFNDKISFSDVTFAYSNRDRNILKNCNFSIGKGECVGLIGKTGGGKSTLLDILLGLLEPTSGELKVDDLTITESNLNQWQLSLSHVPQSIFLLDGTILENVAFGISRPDIDIVKVKKVLGQAKILDDIEQWPEGVNTRVGEVGAQISGGQIQRIGIARALYKSSDLIIFDEATSALDNETERAFLETIRELKLEATIVIVAHRAGTLKLCDRIIELDNGSVSRICKYSEL